MNVSIASYSFHGSLSHGRIDLFGYLESCKYRYGLQTADIWNGMMMSLEAEYLAKVKEALAERELDLANLCVDGPHIWEDDADVRRQRFLAPAVAGRGFRITRFAPVRALDEGPGCSFVEIGGVRLGQIVLRLRALSGVLVDEGSGHRPSPPLRSLVPGHSMPWSDPGTQRGVGLPSEDG